jgi:hypothetical protein
VSAVGVSSLYAVRCCVLSFVLAGGALALLWLWFCFGIGGGSVALAIVSGVFSGADCFLIVGIVSVFGVVSVICVDAKFAHPSEDRFTTPSIRM